jgi:hypothetical protein
MIIVHVSFDHTENYHSRLPTRIPSRSTFYNLLCEPCDLTDKASEVIFCTIRKMRSNQPKA